jgi:hypothetical protein
MPTGGATTPETPAKVAGGSMEVIVMVGMIVVSIGIRIIGIVIIRVGVSIRITVIIIPTIIRGASSQGNNQTQEAHITGLHRVYLISSRPAQPPCKPWLASAGYDVLADALAYFL